MPCRLYPARGKNRGALRLSLPLALFLVLVSLAGCAATRRDVAIEPLPAGQNHADLGLGAGVRPLSTGPGDKSAPSWSPDGTHVAFLTDGYVIDTPLYGQEIRRWTTKDFGAERAEWISNDRLLIMRKESLKDSQTSEVKGEPISIYRTLPGKDSFQVQKLISGALAASKSFEGGHLLVALETSSYESGMSLIRGNGKVEQFYTDLVGGRVTGISLSPDGDRVALAVQGSATFAIYVFDPSMGTPQLVTRLEPGLSILGSPQWTDQGIYYVAGEEGESGKEGATPYNLYQIPRGSQSPRLAPGVGEDFTASSLEASPDGRRLAVIGRRSKNSPTNVYVLDSGSENLKALTTSEDMEIKTGPEDLAWSPSGDSLAIVARGALSGLRVHSAPADSLLKDFYNLYLVPVDPPDGDGE